MERAGGRDQEAILLEEGNSTRNLIGGRNRKILEIRLMHAFTLVLRNMDQEQMCPQLKTKKEGMQIWQ